jgi:hypothetical protein
MEQLAIRLGHQKTMAKSLVIPLAGRAKRGVRSKANEKGDFQFLAAYRKV